MGSHASAIPVDGPNGTPVLSESSDKRRWRVHTTPQVLGGTCRCRAMHSRALGQPTGFTAQMVMRAMCAAALATVAVVVVLYMRIGPVVLTIAPGRGIHTGDSLGLMSAAATLSLLEPFLAKSPATGTHQAARA